MNTAAEKGIAAAAEHSGPDWCDYAFSFVEDYLRNHKTLFVDDLWEAGLSRPASPRALGHVLQLAARSEYMAEQREGDCILARPSKSSNGQLKRVWRSLIFNPKYRNQRELF